METFRNFLECWLNQSINLEELDIILKEIVPSETTSKKTIFQKSLSNELYEIIRTKNYEKAANYIKEFRGGHWHIKVIELFVNYIYNKLNNIPTDVTVHDICYYEKINVLKDFFEEYSQTNEPIMNLDIFIKKFRKNTRMFLQEKLILELNNIIESNNYSKAAHYIKKYGKGTIDTKKVELFVKYLINKLSDFPTSITANDLIISK